MLQLISAFYIVSGLIIMVIVAIKPRLFWPILIFVAVATAGLMMQGKYTFVDEYLMGCVLLGGLLAISMGKITFRKSQENIWTYVHRWVFLLMIIYMIIQSFLGIILLESIGKIHWVVYYGMLGMFSFFISKKGFPVPSDKKISLIISLGTLLYFSLYVVYGVAAEAIRGINRWDMQGIEWTGSAYAMFPLVIAMPAAFFLLKYTRHFHRWIGWISLIVMIVTAFYYESRVAWLAILAFLFFSLPMIGFRRVISLGLIFLLITTLFFWFGNITSATKVDNFFSVLFKNAQAFWAPQESGNLDRHVHMRVAFISTRGNWKNFLFGYGFRMHGFIIEPYLKKLMIYERIKGEISPEYDIVDVLTEPNISYASTEDNVSTEGFTALVVDTGLVGLLLLGLNFLCVAFKIFGQKNNPKRILLLLSLFIMFLWLFVANILDIMLFYLMIMPSGLLIQLSQCDTEEKYRKMKLCAA